MNAQLLISLSGVTPWTVRQADELLAACDRRAAPVTHLVCPRLAERSPSLTEWVKSRATSGDAVLVHGYDQALLPSPRAGYLRKSPEFATLPEHEAGLRLIAAGRVLERIDLVVDGFAPPRWLASAGTMAALRKLPWPVCADAVGVHALRTGAVLRARVHALPASSQRTESLRRFALVASVGRAARRESIVRLAVDVADVVRTGTWQVYVDAVDAALDAGAVPTTYGSLRAARSAAA